MAFRFQKRIKIAPGVRINIGKTGISTTLGPRGASVNIGKSGTHANLGIPGTGLSTRHKLSGGSRDDVPTEAPVEPERASPGLILIVVAMILGLIALFVF